MSSAAGVTPRLPLWLRCAAALLALLVALVLVLLLFPWDTLRGPFNRYVSEKTGRTFEITRRLDAILQGNHERVRVFPFHEPRRSFPGSGGRSCCAR